MKKTCKLYSISSPRSSRDDSYYNLSTIKSTSSEDEFVTAPEILEVKDSIQIRDPIKLKTEAFRSDEAYTFLTEVIRRIDDKITELNDDPVKEYLIRAIIMLQTILLRSRVLFHQNEKIASTSKASKIYRRNGSVKSLPVLEDNTQHRALLTPLKSYKRVRSLKAFNNTELSDNITKSTEVKECHDSSETSLRKSACNRIYKINRRRPIHGKKNKPLPDKNTEERKANFLSQLNLTNSMNRSFLDGNPLESGDYIATSTPKNVFKENKNDNLVSGSRQNKNPTKLKVSPPKKCAEFSKSRSRLADPEVNTSHGLKSKASPPKLEKQTPNEKNVRRSIRIKNNSGKPPIHLAGPAYVTLCIQKALGKPLPEFEILTDDDIFCKKRRLECFSDTHRKKAKIEVSWINKPFNSQSSTYLNNDVTSKSKSHEKNVPIWVDINKSNAPAANRSLRPRRMDS